MEYRPPVQDRRVSVRRNMIYPVVYTRFDDHGRPFDQKPSRCVNVSLGGVRLQNTFRVEPKEVLHIDIALEESLVSFKGEVVYVIHSQGRGFELGISIKEIKNGDWMALNRFVAPPRDSIDLAHDNVIIRTGRIVCPSCGEEIASVARIRDMIPYCKEFLGRCNCGLRYEIRVSSYGSASLSFPDKQIELIC